MSTIALFGGTFDPVHNGHIQISLSVQEAFQFDSYRFIPCKSPTLKNATTASTQQRLEMLQLAIKPYPQFEIDTREIHRQTPSYMVETLESIRQENNTDSITLILGYDAFLSLAKWYQWRKILPLANLLVLNRNQFKEELMPEMIKSLLDTHQTIDKNKLLSHKSGTIYEFNAGDYPISSTQIRSSLNKNTQLNLQVPPLVFEYIKQQRLYP